MLLLLFVVYLGWQRQSTGGASGTGLAGNIAANPSTRPAGQFRVGIYNIQGSVGKSDETTLATIAKTISDTDICGLVEVRANARKSDSRNQAQRLAESLQRGWLFAPSEQRYWAPGGGNGLVSRLPIDRWTRLPLPEANDAGSHRNALLIDLPAGDRVVKVLVTHLDRGESRQEQIAAITHLFQSLPAPAVLLADLNSVPADKLLQPLLTQTGMQDVIGQRMPTGNERVDWILTKGLRTIDAGRVDDPASSDHSFFWADLEPIP